MKLQSLDFSGLSLFLSELKNIFAEKAHKHTYVEDLSSNEQVITYTKGDGSIGSIIIPNSISTSVTDTSIQYRNIVIVPNGTDPSTVQCPVGTIILVKEA